MAVYAPKTDTGTGDHAKVASLVTPNPVLPADPQQLSSIEIDGAKFKVVSGLSAETWTFTVENGAEVQSVTKKVFVGS